MKSIRHFFSSTIFVRILTVSLNFLSSILINRSLGLELKGQYTTILNYSSFIQLFINAGICYAYPFINREHGKEKAKEIISTVIWLQTGVLFIIGIFSFLAKMAINITTIVFLATATLCNGQFSFIALIDDIKSRNYILLSSIVFYIVLNLVAIRIAPGNLYIILALLILKYTYEIAMLTIHNHYLLFNIKTLNLDIIKKVLKIGLPTAVMAILISCNYNIDVFMLNWMKSDDIEIGIYGVAFSLSSMMWIIPDAFKELIYNKSARDNDNHFVLKYIVTNALLCICFFLGFALLGKWFLQIAYGEEYVICYSVCLTLFAGVITMIPFKLIHPIYVNQGKPKSVMGLLLLAIVANIIASWLLIPNYGAFGAAIASVISYAISGLLFFIKYYFDYCKKDV